MTTIQIFVPLISPIYFSLSLSLSSLRSLSIIFSLSIICVCSTDSARTLFQPENWKCLPFTPRWCGSIRTDEIYIHSMASDDYLSLGSVVVCIWQVLARSEWGRKRCRKSDFELYLVLYLHTITTFVYKTLFQFVCVCISSTSFRSVQPNGLPLQRNPFSHTAMEKKTTIGQEWGWIIQWYALVVCYVAQYIRFMWRSGRFLFPLWFGWVFVVVPFVPFGQSECCVLTFHQKCIPIRLREKWLLNYVVIRSQYHRPHTFPHSIQSNIGNLH